MASVLVYSDPTAATITSSGVPAPLVHVTVPDPGLIFTAKTLDGRTEGVPTESASMPWLHLYIRQNFSLNTARHIEIPEIRTKTDCERKTFNPY